MSFDQEKKHGVYGIILRSLGHQGKIRTRDFKGAITLLKRTQRLGPRATRGDVMSPR